MDRSNNIIFLTIDCLRYDCLTSVTTPNINSLKNTSLFFTNAYTEVGHTQASFQALWEGDWIHELKKRGYYTMGVSLNAYHSKVYGYNKGFDYFFEVTDKEPNFTDDAAELNKKVYDHILRASPPTPWFIWIHYMDAHAPYYTYGWDTPGMKLVDCGVMEMKPTKKLAIKLKTYYLDAVKYIDQQVGHLIKVMKWIKQWENTKMIITADHGEEFLEHGKFGHGEDRTGEEVLHIPLLIHDTEKGINEDRILFRDIKNFILK